MIKTIICVLFPRGTNLDDIEFTIHLPFKIAVGDILHLVDFPIDDNTISDESFDRIWDNDDSDYACVRTEIGFKDNEFFIYAFVKEVAYINILND